MPGVRLGARLLDPDSDGDRDACQSFDFGSGEALEEVRRWITEWLWDSTPGPRGETILVEDLDLGHLVGFGTWRHRELSVGDHTETVIYIAWFGVDDAYQGRRTEEDRSIASTLFDTLEARARAHPSSTDDMCLMLEVHTDNTRARGFWEHLGFEYLDTVVVPVNERYRRMIRGAPMDGG